MDDGAERLVWLAVLLPLVVSALQLAIRSWSLRESRWLSVAGLVLASVCALTLLQGTLTSGQVVRGEAIRVLEPSRHSVRSRQRGIFERLDTGRDGFLDSRELGGPVASGDLDEDGRLSATEVAALQAEDGWIGLSPSTARANRHPLLLGASVHLDRLGATLLALLALVGAAFTAQLAAARAGGGASAASLGLSAFALSALMLACVVDSFLFALAGWLVGALVCLAVQHADTLEGAPNPLGVGSFLLVGVAATACLGAVLLTGGGDWRWSSLSAVAPGRATAAAALLGVGVLITALVFPLRSGSPKAWAPSQALAVGGVVPVAMLLLLRARPLFEAHPASWPTAAALGGALALGCAARALVADRLDRALTWVAGAQFGGLLVAVALGSEQAALGLIVVHGAALVGLVLAADLARSSQASWRLVDLGGLSRGRPLLGAAFLLCVLALAGFPPSAGYYALRAAFAQAVHGGGLGVLVSGAWFVGALLAATCLVRACLFSARGRRATRATSPRAIAPAFLGLVALLLCKPVVALGPWAPPGSSPSALQAPSSAAALAVASLCALAVVGAWLSLRRPLAPARGGSLRWLLANAEHRFGSLAPQRRIVQPILGVAARWRDRELSLFEDPPERLAAALWPFRGAPAEEPVGEEPVGRWGALVDSGLFLLFLALLWAWVRTN